MNNNNDDLIFKFNKGNVHFKLSNLLKGETQKRKRANNEKKKHVGFKNNVNTRNLNMSEAAVESRKGDRKPKSKSVSFKNNVNTRNLNMSKAAVKSRESGLREKVTKYSNNVEHILERERQHNRTYRKRKLKNLKRQGKLFLLNE